MNGFARNGHFVLHTSDRDLADYVLKYRPIGKFYARHRIVEMAKELQPDLVLLIHADLIDSETIARVRERAPGCRVACIDFDLITYPVVASRVRRMMEFCDFGFATTGGSPLQALSGGKPMHFIPNVVDIAMDDQQSYRNEPTCDVFFAGKMSDDKYQWQRALALQRLAPELTYFYAGSKTSQTQSPGGIWGYAFIRQLGHSKIGLNLNRVEGDLSSSSRMAQYLGNGCLLATDRASGFEEFFPDDAMIFFSGPEELAERCRGILADGESWRVMAERGRARAIELMSNTLVCRFIEAVTTGARVPQEWRFTGR
ncbi:MAG: glycosyltransferase [Hyphomicrobium sp.]|uniref:glycosyltransferase family protein n=1 Tax=Hyphomicrobium sp. TaxID=82 RepID=UPI003D0D3D98